MMSELSPRDIQKRSGDLDLCATTISVQDDLKRDGKADGIVRTCLCVWMRLVWASIYNGGISRNWDSLGFGTTNQKPRSSVTRRANELQTLSVRLLCASVNDATRGSDDELDAWFRRGPNSQSQRRYTIRRNWSSETPQASHDRPTFADDLAIPAQENLTTTYVHIKKTIVLRNYGCINLWL